MSSGPALAEPESEEDEDAVVPTKDDDVLRSSASDAGECARVYLRMHARSVHGLLAEPGCEDGEQMASVMRRHLLRCCDRSSRRRSIPRANQAANHALEGGGGHGDRAAADQGKDHVRKTRATREHAPNLTARSCWRQVQHDRDAAHVGRAEENAVPHKPAGSP